MKPRVAFIGTGGTIASVGDGPLDLQDYGATGRVLHAADQDPFPVEGLTGGEIEVLGYRALASAAMA